MLTNQVKTVTLGSATARAWSKLAAWFLAWLALARLLAMWLIPLNDTTEARYAEIARKMLETGNWVTQWHDYSIPFWAKPPLSSWLSAGSMGVFGVNAFAARLPAFLLSAGVLALVFQLARRRLNVEAACCATLVLAGSLLFLTSAGTVMTDPALLFAVTLSQVAFWYAVPMQRRIWGYIFFAGLGIGMLAKGPLTLVLVGMPIFFWVLLRCQWLQLWRQLPWVWGTLLMLAIAMPWYALAEMRTPGFLDYFFMGEHVARFLNPGWKGDLYGFAHATRHGMIWLYAIGALFPWSLIFIWRLVWRGRQSITAARDGDGWLLYVVLWSCMTLFFFTLSKNIIAPYALPMVPGFALLFATLWGTQDGERPLLFAALTVLSAVVMLIAAAIFVVRPDAIGRHQKTLVEAFLSDKPSVDSTLLYWNTRREFSAEFYSGGRVRTSVEPEKARALRKNASRDYIAVESDKLETLPAEVIAAFTEIGRYHNNDRVMVLLRERETVSP